MNLATSAIRILIADSSPIFVSGLAASLRTAPGFSIVGTANTDWELLARLSEASPDVVLAEVHAPVDELPGLIDSIHDRFARVILLAQSEAKLDSLPSQLIRTGADGYLVKDCDSSELIRAIRSVHRGESYLTPTLAGHVIQQVRWHGKSEQRRLRISDGLTERELSVLGLIAGARSNREIAHLLGVSERTVENHARKIYRKLQVHDRTQATLVALQRGYLRLPSGIETGGLVPVE